VCLSEKDFMLSDLESIAHLPFIVEDGFQHFLGWNPEMFEGSLYTPISDIYSLGKLLKSVLLERTPFFEEFSKNLINKQLTALHYPWLSNLMP